MRKLFVLIISILMALTIQAFACFNPTDIFATEVVLNKPGINYDLTLIKAADNVTSKDGTYSYRSHYDSRVAVILEEINEGEPVNLKGLSVRVQIPTRETRRVNIVASVEFELEGLIVDNLDKDLLTSLGYSIDVDDMEIFRPEEPGDIEDPISPINNAVFLEKDNILISMMDIVVSDRNKVIARFEVIDQREIGEQQVNEFGHILKSFGVDESVIGQMSESIEKYENQDLAEAVDLDKESFDFKSALRTELDWLNINEIIKGIEREDITAIADIAEAGYAGWNSRIVYDSGKWIPYVQTDNPTVFRSQDCGGFDPEILPWNNESIILPAPSSVSPEAKAVMTWSSIKNGM
ncbi:hypothetical protein GF312_21275 [Candidatus Poribacteria bacterium]|nr:hypothetical protein [Candidatus Poribacteria bacterium]